VVKDESTWGIKAGRNTREGSSSDEDQQTKEKRGQKTLLGGVRCREDEAFFTR